MSPKHRLFKLVLHLYPKPFRDHYGREMIEVLEDLLRDAPTPTSKILVYARTYAELPLSIMQENAHYIGENIMNKTDILKNRKLVLTFAGVIIGTALLTSIFLLGRRSVAVLANPFYRYNITTKRNAEDSALGEPFSLLGKGKRSSGYGCSDLASEGIKTEIECDSTENLYIKISDIGNQSTVQTKIQQLEEKLDAAGYKSGTNGVTVSSLVTGTYKGIDYSPDAFYQKVSGKYHYVFQMNIAYANPAAPAISLRFSCNRTINVFGEPSGILYQSSKGFVAQ